MYSFLEMMFLVEHEHVTSMLQEYADLEEGRELQRIVAATTLSGTQHVLVKEWLPALIITTLQEYGYHRCDGIHTIFDPQTERRQAEQMLYHANYTSTLSERDLLLVPTARAARRPGPPGYQARQERHALTYERGRNHPDPGERIHPGDSRRRKPALRVRLHPLGRGRRAAVLGQARVARGPRRGDGCHPGSAAPLLAVKQ